MRTNRALVCEGCSRPCLPSFPSPESPGVHLPPTPPPSNPFPDPHPSSCPLQRLSGSPSSESKLSRSPGRTMRPAVSEHPGWPRGLGFSRQPALADAQASSGQAGGQSRAAGVAGTPPPWPEKTRAGSRQATEAEKGPQAAGEQGGACAARVVEQKDFTLAGSLFHEPEGRVGGRAGKTSRCLLADFALESP